MGQDQRFVLEPDLTTGVVPISKAASSLAMLLKQAQQRHRPIVITQKGRPTGILVDIELFHYLRRLWDRQPTDGVE